MFTADHHQIRPSAQKNRSASTENGQSTEIGAPATLESLLPGLRRIAIMRATTSPELEADDLFQHMAEDLAIYQRRHANLGNRSYHNQRAWQRATNCIRSARRYRNYVSVMPVCVDEDGQAVDLIELLPAPDASPEEQVIAAERLAELRARLTNKQYQIITLLLQDYSQSDIAGDLGVNKSAVSEQIKTIRRRIYPHEL